MMPCFTYGVMDPRAISAVRKRLNDSVSLELTSADISDALWNAYLLDTSIHAAEFFARGQGCNEYVQPLIESVVKKLNSDHSKMQGILKVNEHFKHDVATFMKEEAIHGYAKADDLRKGEPHALDADMNVWTQNHPRTNVFEVTRLFEESTPFPDRLIIT